MLHEQKSFTTVQRTDFTSAQTRTSVPSLLCVHAQNLVGQYRAVSLDVPRCERLRRLHLVEDTDKLSLNEVHKDEIDECVVRHIRFIGANEIRGGVEFEWGVQGIISDTWA